MRDQNLLTSLKTTNPAGLWDLRGENSAGGTSGQNLWSEPVVRTKRGEAALSYTQHTDRTDFPISSHWGHVPVLTNNSWLNSHCTVFHSFYFVPLLSWSVIDNVLLNSTCNSAFCPHWVYSGLLMELSFELLLRIKGAIKRTATLPSFHERTSLMALVPSHLAFVPTRKLQSGLTPEITRIPGLDVTQSKQIWEPKPHPWPHRVEVFHWIAISKIITTYCTTATSNEKVPVLPPSLWRTSLHEKGQR